MPLYRRSTYDVAPPPEGLDPEADVYQIRFTGEIFEHYEDYLRHFDMYRQRLWSCQSSGKSGLTYEEALISERKHRQDIAKFPKPFRKQTLTFAQYHQGKIEAAAERAYEYFQHRYVAGERVNVEVDGFVYDGRIVRVMEGEEAGKGQVAQQQQPQHTDQMDMAEAGSSLNQAPTNSELTLDASLDDTVSKTPIPPPAAQGTDRSASTAEPPLSTGQPSIWNKQFHIQLLDEAGNDVPGEQLLTDIVSISRKKGYFHKVAFKRYLRETTYREHYNCPYWLVKPELIQKYGIVKEMPDDIRRLKAAIDEKKASKMQVKKRAGRPKQGDATRSKDTPSPRKRAKKEKIKYPIEDTDVPEDTSLPRAPTAKSEFTLPQALVGELLMLFEFFHVFGKPLHLYPFSLDDFEQALRYHTGHAAAASSAASQQPACRLKSAIYIALMRLMQLEYASAAGGDGYGVVTEGDALRAKVRWRKCRGAVTPDFDEDSIALPPEPRQTRRRSMKESDAAGGDDASSIASSATSSLHHGYWEDDVEDGVAWHDVPNIDERTWPYVLLGFLEDIGSQETVTYYHAILQCLKACGPNRTGYYDALPMEVQFIVLRFLVDIALLTSPIREYIETEFEQMVNTRRDMRDTEAERKRIHKEKQSFEAQARVKQLASEVERESLAAATAAAASADGDGQSNGSGDDSGSDDDADNHPELKHLRAQLKQSTRRQDKLRLQQRIRTVKQGIIKAELAQQRERERQRKQEHRAIQDERKRLEDEEASILARRDRLNRQSRVHSVPRVRVVGRDRHHTKYWYLDDVGAGAVLAEGYGVSATGSGRLWLERRDGSWSYYETAEELDALIASLNTKGVRELSLMHALTKQKPMLTEAMARRQADMEKLLREEDNRRSRRNKAASVPFMLYYNRWIDDIDDN